MQKEKVLIIEVENPLPGVWYGLQEGSGAGYQTIQIKEAKEDNLNFEFRVGIKGDPDKDPLPKLSGPFVQGPAAARFIYLNIGASAGQPASCWNRRMKIPLSGISWTMIGQDGVKLKTLVAGRGKDGGPNCATVKPFKGWDVVR